MGNVQLGKDLKMVGKRYGGEIGLFINNVRKLININKLSTDKISDEIGIDRRLIFDYIKGTRKPKIETMLKFCKFFNVSFEDMVTKQIVLSYEFVEVE